MLGDFNGPPSSFRHEGGGPLLPRSHQAVWVKPQNTERPPLATVYRVDCTPNRRRPLRFVREGIVLIVHTVITDRKNKVLTDVRPSRPGPIIASGPLFFPWTRLTRWTRRAIPSVVHHQEGDGPFLLCPGADNALHWNGPQGGGRSISQSLPSWSTRGGSHSSTNALRKIIVSQRPSTTPAKRPMRNPRIMASRSPALGRTPPSTASRLIFPAKPPRA